MGEPSERLQSRLAQGFQRCCVLRQVHSQSSLKIQLALSLFQTLQLLTLLLPLQPSEGDPWAHFVFWPCWYALNAVGRQDRLLQAVLSSAQLTEWAYGGLVGCRLVTLAVSVGRHGWQSKTEYWRLVGGGREGSLGKWLGRVDRAASFLLSGVLAVPALNTLAEAVLRESWVGAVALPAALGCILADRFFLVDLSSKPGNEGPISPQYSLWLTSSEVCAAIVAASFSSFGHFSLLLILCCGLVKVVTVCKAAPFHSAWRNHVETWQGLGLICPSAFLFLPLVAPTAVLAPALLLLLAFPLLLFLSSILFQWHFQASLRQGVVTEAQYAKALLVQQPRLGPRDQDSLQTNPLLAHVRLSKLDLYPLLWTAYYYMSTEEVYFAKLAVGLIGEKQRTMGNTVHIATCIARLYVKLSDTEKSQHSLLLLHSLLTKVEQQDSITAGYLQDFSEGLQHQAVHFDTLVTESHCLSQQADFTKSLYKTALAIYPKRLSLHQAYVRFLQMIGKTQKAERFSHTAFKRTQQTHSAIEGDDTANVLIVVPLTGPKKGRILWTVNASLLNYRDAALKGQTCSVLFPKEAQEKAAELIGLASWNSHTLCCSTGLHVCLMDPDSRIHTGWLQVFHTNDRKTGHLMAIIAITLDSKSHELALISECGETRECTNGFAEFQRATRFSEACRLSGNEAVWRGKYSGEEVTVVKDYWRVCEHHKFPSFLLQKADKDAVLPAKLEISTKKSFASYSPTAFLRKSTILEQGADPNSTSVSSNANFHTHKLSSSLKWQGKALVFTIIAAFIVGSTITIALEKGLSLSALQVNESLADITSIGMRVLSARAAIRSKELYLLNSGFRLYGNETAARLDLQTVSGSLKTMHGYLYGNSSSIIGPFRSLLLEPITPFWRYERTHFERYQVTLLDLIDEMARRSASLASCPIGNITRGNEDFMTLYRNGAAEALSAFNFSVAWYGQSKDQERQHFLSVALLASLLCPLAWLLLLLVLVCPLLYVLERRRRQIWTDALNQSWEMEKQRKKLIHKADFPAKKDTIKTYESSKTMKMLIIASLLYCCFSSLSSLGLCQYGYRSLNPVLESKPGYVDWLGMRRAVTAKGWFHMREAWLPSNVSFPALCPDIDPFYSPVLHWEGANALLLTLQRCLMFGCSTEPIYLSNAHRNLLMDRSPTAVDTPMQAGLTPFLHEIVQLSSAARADLKIDPKTDYMELFSL